MKRNALLTCFILSVILPQLTWAQQTFEKTFGGANEDWAQTAVATDDSGYVFTGITYSWGHGGEDFLMVRINKYGDTVWAKTFGGIKDDYGYRIHKMNDGGYLITGHTDSYGAGDCDGYVVRTNASGDTIWTKTYGGLHDDVIHGAVEMANGDLLMAGFTENFGAQGRDLFYLRTDASGNAKWMKAIGGAGDDIGECIGFTPDGNVLLGGTTRSFGAGGEDFYIVKADTNGNVIWQKTFGQAYNDYFWNMQMTPDGGAVLAGYSFDADSLQSQVFVVKIGQAGEMLWEKNFGQAVCAGARYISLAKDGGYLVTGDIKTLCNGMGDVLLLKLDSAGNVLWQKAFGGPEDENGNYVTETPDGGVLILGRTVSYGAGWSDCYLIKTDNTGNALTGIINLKSTASFSVYPNPTFGWLNVSTPSQPAANSYIQIADAQGKVLARQKLNNENTTVDVQTLSAGTYLYEVLAGEQTVTSGKFVLVK